MLDHLYSPIRLYHYIRRIALHVLLLSYICIHGGQLPGPSDLPLMVGFWSFISKSPKY